jgi:hypothetical protein
MKVKYITVVTDSYLEFVADDGADYAARQESFDRLEELIIEDAKEFMGKVKYDYICEDLQVPDLNARLLYELDSHLFESSLSHHLQYSKEDFKLLEIPL